MNTAADIKAGCLFKRPGRKEFHTAKDILKLEFSDDIPIHQRGKLIVIVSHSKQFVFSPTELFIITHPTQSL